MKEFMFNTSKGIIKCIIDMNLPTISKDPNYPNFVVSEGEIKITKGKKYLDELYIWCGLRLKDGWIIVDLDDGYYGNPEYKCINLHSIN